MNRSFASCDCVAVKASGMALVAGLLRTGSWNGKTMQVMEQSRIAASSFSCGLASLPFSRRNNASESSGHHVRDDHPNQ